jgi:hypothetical protein
MNPSQKNKHRYLVELGITEKKYYKIIDKASGIGKLENLLEFLNESFGAFLPLGFYIQICEDKNSECLSYLKSYIKKHLENYGTYEHTLENLTEKYQLLKSSRFVQFSELSRSKMITFRKKENDKLDKLRLETEEYNKKQDEIYRKNKILGITLI